MQSKERNPTVFTSHRHSTGEAVPEVYTGVGLLETISDFYLPQYASFH